jgi:hypothetical protein
LNKRFDLRVAQLAGDDAARFDRQIQQHIQQQIVVPDDPVAYLGRGISSGGRSRRHLVTTATTPL